MHTKEKSYIFQEDIFSEIQIKTIPLHAYKWVLISNLWTGRINPHGATICCNNNSGCVCKLVKNVDKNNGSNVENVIFKS